MLPAIAIQIISNEQTDQAALLDLLRCYGFHIYKTDGSTSENILKITWNDSRDQGTMNFFVNGMNYSSSFKVPTLQFKEDPELHRRRGLRLALHRLLTNEDLVRGNPWGILTGVRPTKMVHRFIDQGHNNDEIVHFLEKEFAMAPDRIKLLMETVDFQRHSIPLNAFGIKKISLYLGFPFCPSRCSYCSFPGYDIHKWEKQVEPCLEAMIKEIRAIGAGTKIYGQKIHSFYFGGGTPTSMSPLQLRILLKTVLESFDFIIDAEWTIEAGRPETLSEEMLQVLAEFPVRRVCINAQTLNEHTLLKIGRKHTTEDFMRTFENVRSHPVLGSCFINSDLILGLPGESIDQYQESFIKMLALRPDNLTLHHLAIKKGSVLKHAKLETMSPLEAEEAGTWSKKQLAHFGYIPYYLYRQKDIIALGENVGYTLPEKACLYNVYMMEERHTILGLGVGSASKFISNQDWSLENTYNPKDIYQYIERLPDLIKHKLDKMEKVLTTQIIGTNNQEENTC